MPSEPHRARAHERDGSRPRLDGLEDLEDAETGASSPLRAARNVLATNQEGSWESTNRVSPLQHPSCGPP